MPQDKVEILYNSFADEFEIGTLDEFRTSMASDDSRSAFYDHFSTEFDLGTPEEFAVSVGGSLNPPTEEILPQGDATENRPFDIDYTPEPIAFANTATAMRGQRIDVAGDDINIMTGDMIPERQQSTGSVILDRFPPGFLSPETDPRTGVVTDAKMLTSTEFNDQTRELWRSTAKLDINGTEVPQDQQPDPDDLRFQREREFIGNVYATEKEATAIAGKEKYVEDYMQFLSATNNGFYQELLEKGNSGDLDEQERFDLIQKSLNHRMSRLETDLGIMHARGNKGLLQEHNDLIKEIEILADDLRSAREVEGQVSRDRQEEIVFDIRKKQLDLQQLMSPDNEKSMQLLISTAREYQDLFDAQRNLIKAFPGEDLKEFARMRHEEWVKENPNLAIFTESVSSMSNALFTALAEGTNFLLTTPAELTGSESAERFGDWVSDFNDKYLQLTLSDKPFIVQGPEGEAADINWDRFAPAVGQGVTNMFLLLGGGRLASKGLQSMGTGVSFAEAGGLFASSFSLTFGSYYDEAKNAELTDNDSALYAMAASTLTSGLELISPQRAVFGSGKKSLLSKWISLSGESRGTALRNIAVEILKVQGAEVTQETIQLMGDKLVNLVSNHALDGEYFDATLGTGEVAETILVTLATTGLVSGPGIISQNTQARRSNLYAAANNFEAFTANIEKMVARGDIDADTALKLTEEVTKYKEAIDKMPQDIDPDKAPAVAEMLVEKARLESQAGELDEAFKPEIEARQEGINRQIQDELAIRTEEDVEAEKTTETTTGQPSTQQAQAAAPVTQEAVTPALTEEQVAQKRVKTEQTVNELVPRETSFTNTDAKIEATKGRIADHLDSLASAIGAKKDIEGGRPPKVSKVLTDLAIDVAKLTGLKGQKLIEELKKLTSGITGLTPKDIEDNAEVLARVARQATSPMAKQFDELKTKVQQKSVDVSQRREDITSFITENRSELSKVKGLSTPAMMRRVADIRGEKSLQSAKDYIDKAISGQHERDARVIRDRMISTTEKSVRKAVKGKQAKVFSQQDLDIVSTLPEVFKRDAVESQNRQDEITGKLQELEAKKDRSNIPEEELNEIDAEIFNLQTENDNIDKYGNLNGMTLDQIQQAQESLKEDLKLFKESFREQEAARQKKIRARNRQAAVETAGGERRLVDLRSREKEEWFGGLKNYLANMKSPKYLLDSLNTMWLNGEKWLADKGVYGEFWEKLARGSETTNKERKQMRDQIEERLRMDFGGLRKMNNTLKKKRPLTLTEETKDEEGEITVTEDTRDYSTSVLAHLWSSFQSESNHGYTQRIQIGPDKIRMKLTEEEWIKLDAALPENVKDFATWIVDDFLPSRYDKTNKVYFDMTGRNLPQLPGYLFINAKASKDFEASLTDIEQMNIYRPFTKARQQGKYDITNNDLFNSLINFTDNNAKWIGLSQPIRDLGQTINSQIVRDTIKDRGLEYYKRALTVMMTKALNGESPNPVLDFFFRGWVSSKIVMNFSLFAKQQVSLFTLFDADYAPGFNGIFELSKSIIKLPKLLVKKNKAKEILAMSGSFGSRNVSTIESNVKRGTLGGLNDFIDDVAAKADDTKMGKAVKMVAKFTWAPTQVGDRVAIGVGGIALIDATFRRESKRIQKENPDFSKEEVDALAADKALFTFGAWMSHTQQESNPLFKSVFQTSNWRYFTPFMNTPMAYARKVIGAWEDVGKGMAGKRSRLLAENPEMSSAEATARSVTGVRARSLRNLLLFQVAGPLLWHMVTSGTMSAINLASDDDDERRKAWQDFWWDITVGWSKGLFGVGFALDFMKNKAQGLNYGPREDNVFSAADDALAFMEDAVLLGGGAMDQLSESSSEVRKGKEAIEKATKELVLDIFGLVGGPQVFADRVKDILEDEDRIYDDISASLWKLYGIPQKSIEHFYDGN